VCLIVCKSKLALQNGAYLGKWRTFLTVKIKGSVIAGAASRDRGSRDSETVVSIFELRRDTRARGSAAGLDVMPPGATSRGATATIRRPLRIAGGRAAVVAGVIPVRTPLMHVVAQIVKAVRIRRIHTYRFRPALPTQRVIGKQLGRLVSPWVQGVFSVRASSPLPFGFARQAITLGSCATEPLAVVHSFMPGYCDDRHLRVIEVWFIPARRRRTTRGGEKAGVLLVCDLVGSKLERIHPDAMRWFFIVAPRFATHPKPSPLNTHHHGFDGRAVGEIARYDLFIHTFTQTG